jgi:threonyl-tRNA synthetase
MEINSQIYSIRHSLAHILAQAVLTLRPNAKLAFGPPIETGCYYDFLFEEPLTLSDFPAIELEMKRIIKESQPFTFRSLTPTEAISHLKSINQGFKVEYCEELLEKGVDSIGFYQNGPFEDMCAGPHINHTGEIPDDAFRIDSLAGAYWRGDEKLPQLTRIYCLAFSNKLELDEYLAQRSLAETRDHRKLGRELELFSIQHEEIGAGLVLWHPKAGLIRHLMEEHLKRRHLENGYSFVYSPHIGRSSLWQTSGHLEFYKDGMFAPIEIEGQEFYLKPMNCPFHCHIYKNTLHSYKELPLRFAEWGTVYRFERSGTLHGLTRVRGFTQDDAHLFCRSDQMPEEIDRTLKFSLSVLRDFSFSDFHIYLSTRPAKRVGEEDKWNAAEEALTRALDKSGVTYSIKEGDGAFYGPKIDVCVKDALKREWQLSTIQFDFNLPERFNLSYIGEDGAHHRPYMVHRALLGSIERFFALLVEHLGGAFPTWLAPVQVKIIPVRKEVLDYASKVASLLRSGGVRVEIDETAHSFNKRIREGVTAKIPHLLVIGNKEVEGNSVTRRSYGSEDQFTQSLEEVLDFLKRDGTPPQNRDSDK